jgi:hypothetical protein
MVEFGNQCMLAFLRPLALRYIGTIAEYAGRVARYLVIEDASGG